MRHHFRIYFLLTGFLLIFLGGCATNRSIVPIDVPATGQSTITSDKSVFINTVTDQRVFEVKPSEPKTPSLDPDEEQNDAIKSRAIARKRNTFGKGLGDIILPEGQTVNSIITRGLTEAFKSKGYKIISKKDDVEPNTYFVNTRIDQFWSWMNPGFWAISLNTEIITELSVDRDSERKLHTITVLESENFQTGAESNWSKVMNNAIKSYIAKVAEQID